MRFAKFRERFTHSHKDDPRNEAPHEQDHQGDQARPTGSPSFAQPQQDPKSVQHSPKKLQRPPPQYYNGPNMYPPPNQANMYPGPQIAPPVMNAWGGEYSPNSPPQWQPSFAPFPRQPGYVDPPQQYPAYPPLRAEPPTPTLELMRQWPARPTIVPPYSAPCWLPSQPAVDSMDSRGVRAVPMYEMPPSDLMDYDMSWMLGVRMLPEWNKYKEDEHWEQVRRMRNAAAMRQMRGDSDSCII
ncbi:MAG: hypothetical protein Q9218_007841, partial [Villophora microphyllina]